MRCTLFRWVDFDRTISAYALELDENLCEQTSGVSQFHRWEYYRNIYRRRASPHRLRTTGTGVCTWCRMTNVQQFADPLIDQPTYPLPVWPETDYIKRSPFEEAISKYQGPLCAIVCKNVWLQNCVWSEFAIRIEGWPMWSFDWRVGQPLDVYRNMVGWRSLLILAAKMANES